MVEWADIETAPKDGTRVLLYHPFKGAMSGEGLIITGHWMEDYSNNEWQEGWVQGNFKISPTHWMSLPSKPVSK